MKKLILWDLDGTLIDTLEDLGAAVDYALEQRGLPLPGLTAYRGMVGRGVRNLVKQALEWAVAQGAGGGVAPAISDSGATVGLRDELMDEKMESLCKGRSEGLKNEEKEQRLTDEAIDSALGDFMGFYTAHIDVHTHPYPGIPQLVAELQAAGIKMAVTSNKFQEGTEFLIRKLFPEIDFVAILGNRPGLPLKPSPEIVREVLSRAKLEPQDAILVGDSPVDMQTALNGGIEAIAVGWGYCRKEELAGKRLVGDVDELRKLLM